MSPLALFIEFVRLNPRISASDPIMERVYAAYVEHAVVAA